MSLPTKRYPFDDLYPADWRHRARVSAGWLVVLLLFGAAVYELVNW